MTGSPARTVRPEPAGAPLWRREPYRVFFPLGLLIGWAGVLHWLLHGLGVLGEYRPVFHAIVQIEGFLMCFALGFLLTAIPRRTGTGPPGAWQIVLAIACTLGVVVCAWMKWFGVSQVFWLAVVVTLITFVARRLRGGGGGGRPPNSFVWIPLSLLMGVTGALLIATYGVLGAAYYQLHEIGRLLLLQGMFTGLVVGAGGMVLPLITRGEGPPGGAAGPRDRLARISHGVAALLLAGSYWWQNSVGLRSALVFQAALLLLLLVAGAGIWRPPSVPGWHRRLVWLAPWLLPAGYALAALFPAQRKAGLHVAFIGGFALLALSVGLHVALEHADDPRARGRPWQVPVYAGLLLIALGLRVLMDFDTDRFFVWLSAAAGTFLVATLVWSHLVLPLLWRRSAPVAAARSPA